MTRKSVGIFVAIFALKITYVSHLPSLGGLCLCLVVGLLCVRVGIISWRELMLVAVRRSFHDEEIMLNFEARNP